MRNIITAIALSGLIGCSPAPKNVKPLPVAAGTFSGLSCPALLTKRGHELGQAKGELAAVNREMAAKGC